MRSGSPPAAGSSSLEERRGGRRVRSEIARRENLTAWVDALGVEKSPRLLARASTECDTESFLPRTLVRGWDTERIGYQPPLRRRSRRFGGAPPRAGVARSIFWHVQSVPFWYIT